MKTLLKQIIDNFKGYSQTIHQLAILEDKEEIQEIAEEVIKNISMIEGILYEE